MTTITVSSKFQIVIPRVIREALGIRPGEKLHAIEYRGRIELVLIDYVQLVRPPAPNRFAREQEVASISRELKALAKDFDVPMVAL